MFIKNNVNASAETVSSGKDVAETTEEPIIVFSYLDIFEGYYTNAIKTDPTFSTRCSFEEFVDGYYKNNLSIVDYTTAKINGTSTRSSGDSDNLGGGPNGTDAYYILKESLATDKSTTPTTDFARKPIYATSFNYNIIDEGDIIYETNTDYCDIGHLALVYDIDKNSGYGAYIQTIEAVGGGVQYGYLDDSRMIDYAIKILRVYNVSSTSISNVKTFAWWQLGKPYELNYNELNTSIYSDDWYCSELIYACYLYVGIDLDPNDGNMCIPADIDLSPYTYEIINARFLTLRITGKIGSIWHIEIENPFYDPIVAYYNSKMCYKDHAKNWSGLNDVVPVSLSANGYAPIDISENWFATSIAVSYVSSGFRIITYADNLNTNGQLTVYHCVIEV